MADGAGWPRVLLVTDRRRLVARMGARDEDWPELLGSQVEAALAGGADLVQVREPDLTARVLARFLRQLFERLPDRGRRVVVNDRADVAMVTGAGGVHLTELSPDPADVRRLRPADKRWVMGRSVHDPGTAGRHRDADYLLAGTVRASASKPAGWRVLGWEGLAAIVRAAGTTPVVAIGGLTAGDAEAVRRAGAVGLAGIGCFLPEAGADLGWSVRSKVERIRMAFDSTGGGF
jgi:thiamine-phosphate pyrophosphorylase